MNIYTVMMILYIVILLLLFIVGFILIRMQRLSRKVVGMEISPAEVAHFMEEMRSIVLDSEKIAASLEGSIREKEMLLEDTTELVDAKIHKLELLMTHMEDRIKATEPMVGGNDRYNKLPNTQKHTETVFEMEQKLEAQAQPQPQPQPQPQQMDDPVPWLKPASPYSNNEIGETLNIMTDNSQQPQHSQHSQHSQQPQQPQPRITSPRPQNSYRDVMVHRGFPNEDNIEKSTLNSNTNTNLNRNKYNSTNNTKDILYRDEHSSESDLSWVIDQDEYLPTTTIKQGTKTPSNEHSGEHSGGHSGGHSGEHSGGHNISDKHNAQLQELSMRDKVIKLHNDGLSNIDIARELGISTTEVKLVLNMR